MKRWSVTLLLAATLAFGADLTGEWTAEVVTDAGSGNPSFTLRQEGNRLTGVYRGQLGESKLSGSIEGNKVSFSFTVQMGGESGTVRYTGEIENGNRIRGKVDLAGMAEGSFTMSRKPQD